MKNQKGITLIALIITIIVMLILVAVTITMAVNGGLFGYAGNAARDTESEKQKEINWTNPEANMTTDQLIEKYTGYEKEWSIGWVYKNGTWSNPYFKDEELGNSFTIGNIDTSYSINSEDELTGQFVVKFYPDGELVISGTGAIPDTRVYENQSGPTEPWDGGYFCSGNPLNESPWELYTKDYDLQTYLENNISTIKISEGITSIPYNAFYCSYATDFAFPSTIINIDTFAFENSTWLRDLDISTPGYSDYEDTWFRCVDVEINGNIYKLALYYLD